MSTELVERLRAHAESGFATDHKTDCAEAADELTALTAKVALLTEALKPFAEYMGDMDRDHLGNPLPDDAGVGWVYLNQGHFRAARRALSEPDK